MQNEVWKFIEGSNNLYQASNLGRIRSLHRGKEKIIKGNKNKRNGYWMTHVSGRKRETHRFIAETWIPKVEGKNQVNHIDGNKLNNRVDNLEWCSPKENINHMIKGGKIDHLRPLVSERSKGSKNVKAKLNEDDVLKIKKNLLINLYTCKELAKKYNVNIRTIYGIKNNKYWKHVIL